MDNRKSLLGSHKIGNSFVVGRNEPAVPSAAVRLGRLGSGGSARRRCRPAGPPAGTSAGRTAGTYPAGGPAGRLNHRPAVRPADSAGRAVPTHPPTTPQGSPG